MSLTLISSLSSTTIGKHMIRETERHLQAEREVMLREKSSSVGDGKAINTQLLLTDSESQSFDVCGIHKEFKR